LQEFFLAIPLPSSHELYTLSVFQGGKNVKLKMYTLGALFVVLMGLLAACGGGSSAATTANGKTTISLWTHSAGNPLEMDTLKKEVAAFNASQSQYQVVIQSFPQASYNTSVSAAALSNKLPCLMDMDNPTVANFAWSKYVQPLPITDAQVKDMGLLDSAIGRYQGKIYSLGQFDVALTMFARKSILEKYNIRIPTLDQPWTLAEFNGILAKLKSSGAFQYPFDLNPQYTGEWWPYAYSPMLQSFGGDLINRSSLTTADGVLNSPAAIQWGQWFQGLFKNGDANVKPTSDQGFLQGKIPLWYTGSWAADSVVQKYGKDALFLPAVNFGTGTKIGGGSWEWGISAACPQQASQGAWQFIKSLMQPANIAMLNNATGLIPTTPAAAALVPRYAPGGAYRILFDMLSRFTVMRPATPAYLTISSQFEQAGLAISQGTDVATALNNAVNAIDTNIQDHNNYQQ
jgi:multiple sugar transport system substrate-binding protein